MCCSNSSFIECLRNHHTNHLSNIDINECTGATFTSSTPCKHTGSHLPYNSGSHTFTNVDFKECYSSNDSGGAIKCTGTNTQLTVTGCTFKECYVSLTSSYSGGGIYAHSIKSVSTQSSLFTNCYGYDGGGLFINSISSTPDFFDCVFISCQGQYLGGGAFVGKCSNGASPIACSDTSFIGCTNVSSSPKLYGGGFYLDIYAITHANTVSNVLFTQNSANMAGGALGIYESEHGFPYSVKFCFFSYNTASGNGKDVVLVRTTFNSILNSFTASQGQNRLWVNLVSAELATPVNIPEYPNWLP